MAIIYQFRQKPKAAPKSAIYVNGEMIADQLEPKHVEVILAAFAKSGITAMIVRSVAK